MRTLKTYRKEHVYSIKVNTTRRVCETEKSISLIKDKTTIKIIRLLLLDFGGSFDINKNKMLHQINNEECIKMMMYMGAYVDAKNDYGRTPFFESICESNYKIEIIDLLLSYGADINTRDNHGNTPLHIVTMYLYKENMEVLLSRMARLYLKNKYGHTPLYNAVHRGDMSVVKILLKWGAVIGNCQLLLHAAVTSNSIEMVEFILAHDIDVHETTRNCHTALHSACMLPAVVEIIWLLISLGIDINAKDDKGNTALNYFGGYECYIPRIKLLLDNGANINEKNEIGETLLYKAVRKDVEKTVKFLISRGADIHTRNNKGESPYSIASNKIKQLMNGNIP